MIVDSQEKINNLSKHDKKSVIIIDYELYTAENMNIISQSNKVAGVIVDSYDQSVYFFIII